jgi:hypothetical protein
MRSRTALFTLVAAGSLALPLVASAAIPFFGPIIPDGANTCPAGWGMFIEVVNNLISFLITIAIVFIAPLMIAWAGALLVLNPTSLGDKAKAKSILSNTVIGIVVALVAWLIVDLVMVTLYNGELGTWQTLITSGGSELCIEQKGTKAGEGLNQAGITGVSSTGVVQTPQTYPTVGVARAPCADVNKACSVSAILQGASMVGVSLTNAQATAMSCIAMTESSGNPNIPNSPTGACGTFQITTRPGNWGVPAFHQSPCSTTSSCNDAYCNLQTAMLLYKQRGYQPWTGKKPDGTYWNGNAVACVQKYDPGGKLN